MHLIDFHFKLKSLTEFVIEKLAYTDSCHRSIAFGKMNLGRVA